jgi:DNA-binding Xre family transcriptional regulator
MVGSGGAVGAESSCHRNNLASKIDTVCQSKPTGIETQYQGPVSMSTTVDLVQAVKNELKSARMTYADLARGLGMAESSVKRMLAKGDMPLSRVDAICRALKIDFAELARRVADAQPLLRELTQEQEKAVVRDKKLLLVAINVLSQWTLEQIVAAYRITEAECIACLVQLDRIGIIELRPLNRYRLKLAKTFRWRPHGPVMDFFRENVVLDYYRGGFDGPAEGLLLVHGSISRALAPSFLERLQRVAQDFAQQHQTDQKLSPNDREGYTLLLGMRNWEFEAFTRLRRSDAKPAKSAREP